MTTIADDRDLITKVDCDKNKKFMSDKFDEFKSKFIDFELKVTESLAKMPKTLADEFDKRYARKGIEQEVKDLKNKGDNRLWEGSKMLLELLIALGIAYIAVIK